MTKSLKKIVLKHFTLKPRPSNQKLDSYKCNYCTQSYVCHSTRMSEHLLECKGCPAHIKATIDEKLSSKSSKSKKRKFVREDSDNSNAEEEITPAVSKDSNSSTFEQHKKSTDSERINKFFDKMTKKDQEYCETLLAKAIFTGGIPFRFIENEYFLEFLAYIRPTFKPPTRAQLSGALLNTCFSEVESVVKKKINEAKSVTIQCDSYSNINNEGVMNFIINTPTPVFYKHVEVKAESQTGEYLANEVSKVIDEVGPQKTMALMTDNASYCKKGWDIIQEKYEDEQIYGFGCAAHTLNLFCQDIVNESPLKLILEDTVKIVKAVKQSHILSSALKDFQKSPTGEEEQVLVSLKLPGKTRWGSSLTCLSSVYDNKYNLKKLAISMYSDRLSKQVKDDILNDSFWWKVSKLIDLLKPVVVWLKKIEGDESLISEMVGMFEELQSHMRNNLFNSAPAVLNLTQAQHLLNKLVRRTQTSLTPMHFAANILNPSARGKALSAENYASGYDLICKLMKKYGTVSEDKLLLDLVQYTSETGFWSSESVKKSSTLICAVNWWAGTCGCTHLSKVAVPILSLPCSSAATERSFSTYGWIHNAKRNRFTVAKAIKVTYVAHNLKLLNTQQTNKENRYIEDESDDEDFEEADERDEATIDIDNSENSSAIANVDEGSLILQRLPSNIPEGIYILQQDSSLVYENLHP